MKIVIIIGSFKVGGAERMSINTGQELAARGHDVHYIVQRPIFEIPNTINKDKIHVLRKKNNSGLGYKFLALFYGIGKAIRKIDPDVVIAFSRFSSFLANFSLHPKIIARFDAYPYRLTKKQHVWADMVIKSPFTKKIVIPSSDMINELLKIRPAGKHKFKLISNSIDTSLVDKPISRKYEHKRKYITAMGRLSWQKNFELLIEAYRNSDVRMHYDLIIIGGGPNEEQLKNLVSQYDLNDKITFTGRMENPFPVISGSEFFVNPSKFESFGNVMLEALLLGKPVIATNCNYGPADIVIDDYNGTLIESDNVNQLVEVLNKWTASPEIIEGYRKNTIKSATKFDINKIGDQWEQLIHAI